LSNNILLTRTQIQQLATFFALDAGIEKVEIEERSSSGIGLSTTAYFFKDKIENNFEADITDVSTW